jgi:hypothetical protein
MPSLIVLKMPVISGPFFQPSEPVRLRGFGFIVVAAGPSPCPIVPWHCAQFFSKSSFPWVISSLEGSIRLFGSTGGITLPFCEGNSSGFSHPDSPTTGATGAGVAGLLAFRSPGTTMLANRPAMIRQPRILSACLHRASWSGEPTRAPRRGKAERRKSPAIRIAGYGQEQEISSSKGPASVRRA